MFKHRVYSKVKTFDRKLYTFDGIFSSRRARFETVYARIFYKLFRRRRYTRHTRFKICKIFVFISPYFALTMKSKNARMGAGVGKFVRLCCMLKAGRPFLLTHNVPSVCLQAWCKLFNHKWRFSFFWGKRLSF